MNILSIQSWVSYGHVGNASAIFPLQRLGAEVWAINTVQFSNHTGYGDWTGAVYSGQSVRELVDESRHGARWNGAMRANGVCRWGRHRRRDHARGNDGSTSQARGDVLLRSGDWRLRYRGVCPARYRGFLRTQALPAADIATPNRFEIERLTGLDCSTLHGAKRAVLRLRSMLHGDGPASVLLTSLETDSTPADCIDMMTFSEGAFHLLRTPRLRLNVNGAGDAIAALFLFHLIRTGSAVAALEAAGSSIYGLLRRTAEAGSREILTVAAAG